MLPTKTNVILRTQQSLSKTTGRKRFPRLRRLQTELFRYGLELADYNFRRPAGVRWRYRGNDWHGWWISVRLASPTAFSTAWSCLARSRH